MVSVTGTTGRAASPSAAMTPEMVVVVDQRACGVLDQDEVGLVGCERLEAREDRALAGRGAADRRAAAWDRLRPRPS